MNKIFAVPYMEKGDERLTETLHNWKWGARYVGWYGPDNRSVAVLVEPVASEAHAAMLHRLRSRRRQTGRIAIAFDEYVDVIFAEYSDVQSVASRFPKAVFAPPPREGKAGAHDRGLNVGKDGDSDQGDGADGGKSHGKRWGGTGRHQLWVPMPTPRRDHVERARRLLQILHEEVVETARENAAVRWDYARLAVRGEMGQLDPARVWERLGTPRLMLALDNSGSMGPFVNEVMALGAALAKAMPWLLVIAAPNGNPAPLFAPRDGNGEVHAILDGQPWRPDAPVAYQEGVWSYATLWDDIARKANVAGAIYVGDWEDDFLLEMKGVARKAAISVFESSWRFPTLTDRHYGMRRPYPVIIGCGSTYDFLAALEMVLHAWRSV